MTTRPKNHICHPSMWKIKVTSHFMDIPYIFLQLKWYSRTYLSLEILKILKISSKLRKWESRNMRWFRLTFFCMDRICSTFILTTPGSTLRHKMWGSRYALVFFEYWKTDFRADFITTNLVKKHKLKRHSHGSSFCFSTPKHLKMTIPNKK